MREKKLRDNELEKHNKNRNDNNDKQTYVQSINMKENKHHKEENSIV